MTDELRFVLYCRGDTIPRERLSFGQLFERFDGAPKVFSAMLMASDTELPVQFTSGRDEYFLALDKGEASWFGDYFEVTPRHLSVDDDAPPQARRLLPAPAPETPRPSEDLARPFDIPVTCTVHAKVRVLAHSERHAAELLLSAAGHQRLPEPRFGQTHGELRARAGESLEASLARLLQVGDESAGDWGPDARCLLA